MRKIPFAGVELTSQRVRGLRGTSELPGRPRREFEELSFEIGKESMRDYIARAKALVMKLDQNNVSTTEKEMNRRILNGLPHEFDVEKNMLLLMTDTDPDELGEALTRVDDSRTKNGGAGGTHASATGAKPRGGGRGAAAGLDGIVEAVATLAVDATAKINIIIINSSNGLHSIPRDSSSRKRISGSGSHRSGNYSSIRNHQDTLAGGDHRALVFDAASPDISMQNVELYLPHHQTHVPQHHTIPRSTIIKLTTLRLLLEITRLLRRNTDTKCPRRRPRKERRHLPIRPGASRPSGP